MSHDENSAIFRGNGNCKAVLTINQVDELDVRSLVEEHKGAPGEQTIFVFPVRSQETWYRAKYEKGFIETEIVKEDEYRALVKASVYDDGGQKLAVAHGTSTAEGDGVNGFKLIETAESRAISRALDAAGFGCQLSAKTYDFGDATPSVPTQPGAANESDSDTMPAMPNEAPMPAKTPDQINTSKKVSANGTSQPEDISALTKGNAQASAEPEKKTTGRKKKTEQPTPDTSDEAQKPVEADVGNTPAAAAPETPSNTSAAVAPEAPSIDRPVEEIVEEAVKTMPDIQTDGFDPVIFGEGSIDCASPYVNKKGVVTGMSNGELQKSMNFLAGHKGMAQKVSFLTQNKQLEGKTFGQVYDMGELGRQAIKTCALAYSKKNVVMMAAALMFYFKTPKTNESGNHV